MRGKQNYFCNSCGHRWVIKGRKTRDVNRDYKAYLLDRQTLSNVAGAAGVSVKTLRQYFDALPETHLLDPAPDRAVNLVIDAVFFGRSFGFLCFCENKRIVYARQIKTESVTELRASLAVLLQAGYRFKSFTLDGKRGFINVLQNMFPHTPIQMCHFHQKAIIRRYITMNPKSPCGKALKEHMTLMDIQEPQVWIDELWRIKNQYQNFLKERNDNNQFIHKRLRSAFRSINAYLPYLFQYKELPSAQIPNTTNSLEGKFSHIKEKIKIHRGLCQKRKIKAIKLLIKST